MIMHQWISAQIITPLADQILPSDIVLSRINWLAVYDIYIAQWSRSRFSTTNSFQGRAETQKTRNDILTQESAKIGILFGISGFSGVLEPFTLDFTPWIEAGSTLYMGRKYGAHIKVYATKSTTCTFGNYLHS